MARSLQKIVLEQREELRRLLAQDVLVRSPMRRVDAESHLARAGNLAVPS